MRYYIGLDNGGTTTKAAVFDSQGKQLGSCSVATSAITPRPEYVERDMEDMPKAIRLSGGAAKSPVWAQMFADVMQLPVETVEAEEAGALGCAVAATVATGEYPSMDEAIRNMTVVSRAILPDTQKKEIYDRKYRLYRKTIECLDGLWDEMQSLVEISG